jgi:predicted nuclease with TOPRIM domain
MDRELQSLRENQEGYERYCNDLAQENQLLRQELDVTQKEAQDERDALMSEMENLQAHQERLDQENQDLKKTIDELRATTQESSKKSISAEDGIASSNSWQVVESDKSNNQV